MILDSYTKFEESFIRNDNYDIRLDDRNLIGRYYDNKPNTLVIDKYIQMLEDVYHGKREDDWFYPSKELSQTSFHQDIFGILCMICHYIKLSGMFRKESKTKTRLERYEREVYRIYRDRERYKKQLKKFLHDYDGICLKGGS